MRMHWVGLGVAGWMVLVAACGTPASPMDGASSRDAADVPSAHDTGTVTDAPGIDAPVMDAPASMDVPVARDVPAADVPVDAAIDAGIAPAWLQVHANRITYGDGRPFRGRGVDFHDERSCEACSFAPRDPDGVNRWADEIIHTWHATFIRFLLSSKSAPYNSSEVQWQNLVDDPQYYADIQTNVHHMTANPGVYVLVTLFADPTMKDNNGEYDSEWPSSLGDSNTRYRLLAEAFYDDPQVLFGLTNEPHTTPDHDAALAAVYVGAIDAIRAVEDAHHTPHHLIAVQAPEGYARDLTYFVAHPIARDHIVYEIHPYNHAVDFDALIVQPSRVLPVIIGEYGPASLDGTTLVMNDSDVMAMWTVAQANEVPYIGWNFHMRCPPNLLVDTTSDGCGLAASTGFAFPRTAWGDLLFAHLATPW